MKIILNQPFPHLLHGVGEAWPMETVQLGLTRQWRGWSHVLLLGTPEL